MYIYIGIYAVLALFAMLLPAKKRTAFFIIVWMFLVWFMGFRYETGCDYLGYLHRWYISEDWRLGEDINLRTPELGFALLMHFSRVVGFDYTQFNVLISSILVTAYIVFSRTYKYSPIILTLLFPIVIVQLGMSGVRQALAGCFIMLCFKWFMVGNKLRSSLWVLLGVQFHSSAALFFALSFMAGEKFNLKKMVPAGALVLFFVNILVSDRVDTYIDRYSDNSITSAGAVMRYLLNFLPVLPFLYYRKQIEKRVGIVFGLLNVSAHMILLMAPLAFFNTLLLHRLNYYVAPLSILLLLYTSSLIFAGARHGLYFSVGVYGVYMFIWFSTSWHASRCYVPYNNTLYI